MTEPTDGVMDDSTILSMLQLLLEEQDRPMDFALGKMTLTLYPRKGGIPLRDQLTRGLRPHVARLVAKRMTA